MINKKTVPVAFIEWRDETLKWVDAETQIINEIEDDKVVIPLKITNLGSYWWGGGSLESQQWERDFRKFATYTIKPIEFTLLEEIKYKKYSPETLRNEGKEIVIDSIFIVWKDLKTWIKEINDIFHKGVEIKLKLGQDWSFWEQERDGRKGFSIAIWSDYEIIKSDGTIISFPLITSEDFSDRKLKDKWNKESRKEEKLEAKKIFQEIKENPNDWRIEESGFSKIINKKGNYHYVGWLGDYLENSDKKEWLEIKEIIVNNQKREEIIQELQEKKLVDCEKVNQLKNIELDLEYSKLSSEEKNKLVKSVFENIKKNKEGWNIKEIITLDHFGRDDYQTKELLIIHNSAQLKYNLDGMLIFDRSKMWEKSFFSQEQQKELENILPVQQSFQEQKETKLKKYGEYALYGGLILVILLGIWWIIRKIK